jgi:NTE family protein
MSGVTLEELRKRERELRASLEEVLEQQRALSVQSGGGAGELRKSFDTLRTEAEDLKLDRERVESLAPEINHLVFEGGGIRGIAFGGTLRFMEEYGLDKYVKGLAGSSAGAIVAAGVAVGYTSQEFIDVLSETNFATFKDDSWGVVFDIIRLFTQYGIYKGDAFFKWFSGLMEKKTGNANITFKEVYERYGKTLVITGSCLNKAQSYYFHHLNEKYADMPIALAVRISMSIPLYFKAVKLGEDTMVDGGVLNNYPIWVFDGKFIGDPNVSDATISQSKTMGFKLMTESEQPDSTLYHVDEKIDGPVEYSKAFLNAMLIQIERGHIRDGYWKRTVCINTHDISSLDFSLPDEKKKMLIHEGYIAAKNHFHCYLEGKENEMNSAITPN